MSVGTIFYGKLPLSQLQLCDTSSKTNASLTYNESTGVTIDSDLTVSGLNIDGVLSATSLDITGNLTAASATINGALSTTGQISMTNNDNVVIAGTNASLTHAAGGWNTVVGSSVMTNKTSGGYCTGIGNAAANRDVSCSSNTSIGASAGDFDVSGTQNTYLGFQATQLSSDTTQYSNTTLIGANCIPNATQATAPNGKVVLGTSTTPVYIPYGFDYLPLNNSNATGLSALGNLKEGTINLIASIFEGTIYLQLMTISDGATTSYTVFSTAVNTTS